MPYLDLNFKACVAASYDTPEGPPHPRSSQYLQIEDFYYAGAKVAYRLLSTKGLQSTEALLLEAELEDFGDNILRRYREAGLI
jgi:hypothetical protein